MNDAGDRPREPIGADLSGRQLGDYRLLRRLGRGAMAEVYLAEQCSLNRQVAVKVLKSQLASDQTYVQRFQREARAAAALVHANIVQIHEVGCIDGVYFIAQEYVQGFNLRQWMTRNGALDLRMALIIMRQVAAALAKAAEQGIVHRDIKPENIMITRSGEVKVADFGLARLTRVGDSVDLTQAGMTMGTPLYMSPEQVEGHSLDPRSDIYSFGVTCYYMLSGSPPFKGETALSVAVQHLKKQPDSLENLRRDLPAALCRIVHKMLAKSRENRYQSARELLKDLRQVQLEHLGEEKWPEDLPGWETAGLDLATSLTETTQRLDGLMKTAAHARGGRYRRLLLGAAVLAAFLAGGTLAYFTALDSPLLALAENGPTEIRKLETVEQQWIDAVHRDREEAWWAVVRHWPKETSYVYQAKRKLAYLYIREQRFTEAMDIFDDFIALEESERELQTFGLVGKYCILARQQRYEEAADVLKRLGPLDEIKSQLQQQDPEMYQMFESALEEVERSRQGPRATTIEQ